MTAPVVVLGCGNPSRGDDALGPALLDRAERLCAAEGLAVDCVADFQLQVEHALDLAGRALCLFVDAAVAGPAPLSFTAAAPRDERAFTSHALGPAGVLDAYRRFHGTPPPPAYVLAVRGYTFELGDALSAAAADHLERAWALLARLLRAPTAGAWEAARLSLPPSSG